MIIEHHKKGVNGYSSFYLLTAHTAAANVACTVSIYSTRIARNHGGPMSPLKKALFWAQIVAAVGFGGPQIYHATQAVEGTSLSNFILNSLYFLVLVILGWNSHKRKPTPTSIPSVVVCAVWLVIMLGVSIATGLNPEYEFSPNDKYTFEAAALVLLIMLFLFMWKGKSFTHPSLKGWIGIATKSLPQATLAIKIGFEGGGGIAASFILAGLLSIGLRLIQLVIQWRETKTGERNLKWMIIADGGNLITWTAVSIVWWIVR